LTLAMSAMQIDAERAEAELLLSTVSISECFTDGQKQEASESVQGHKSWLLPNSWSSRATGILLVAAILGMFKFAKFLTGSILAPTGNTLVLGAIELWGGSGAAHIVWPPETLEHAGDNCWSSCNGTGGDCSWCGAGNACCRWHAEFDPEECYNVKNFVSHSAHTCVQPTYPVMVKHQGQDCWEHCNQTGGFCDWCGHRNACCRKNSVFDPQECKMAIYFPTDEHHTCVATTAGCAIGTVDSGNGECVKPPIPQILSFYIYRAKSRQMYQDTNVNGGNLAGVMWYIHNEVMDSSCPRKFEIDRIVRYKLTMKATQALYDKYKINFDLYRQFDKGKCTHAQCEQTFEEIGYAVGCIKNDVNVANYTPSPVWYDLPGPCPSKEWDQKTEVCMNNEPGGECPAHSPVTGEPDCTWKLVNAGHVMLDELSGIESYEQFCDEGKKEYVRANDTGVGFHFWDGKHNAAMCTTRMNLVQMKFKEKYPYLPLHLGEPECDGYR